MSTFPTSFRAYVKSVAAKFILFDTDGTPLRATATVTLEALPGKAFSGKVVEIGASALPVTGTGAAAREFKVVVRLDRPEAGLRPGLTCDAEIVASERTNVLTVPLQSVVLRPAPNGADPPEAFTRQVEPTTARMARTSSTAAQQSAAASTNQARQPSRPSAGSSEASGSEVTTA